MKRIVTLTLLVLALLTLCACGAAEKAPELPAGMDLEAVYQSLMDAQADTGMDPLFLFPESNEELIANFYPGLGDLDLAQMTLYMHPVTGAATEVCLAEAADADNAKAAAEVFQARIDHGAAGTGCEAEDGANWAKHGTVQTAGNYVAMICLPEGYTVPENIFTAFAAD